MQSQGIEKQQGKKQQRITPLKACAAELGVGTQWILRKLFYF